MRWFKVTLGTIKAKSHPDRRDAGRGLLYHQTNKLHRSATMHKSGYASPKIQVNANNKHTSGTEMDFAYHKMHKIASNGIFSWKQGNIVGLQVLFCAHTLVTS